MADTAAPDFDVFNKSPESTQKLSNKEIREIYFDQLRCWMTTVNSYESFYNKLQEYSLPNEQNSLNDSADVPTEVSNSEPEPPSVVPVRFVGIRCQVPSLWKRFGAEVIDFLILSTIKFMVAYFIVDSLMDIDFTKYNSIFLQDDFNVDYTTAIEMTSEIFFLEISHRIVVCAYEVYLLQGNTLFHGSATIGKILLDLTVVRADKLYHIRGQPLDVVVVSPGDYLGWKRATLRSIAKNLLFAFLFPLPFVAAAANQNRSAYDVLCGSMVVEIVQPLRCEESDLIPINN